MDRTWIEIETTATVDNLDVEQSARIAAEIKDTVNQILARHAVASPFCVARVFTVREIDGSESKEFETLRT